jgi:hexosaminidase
VNEVKRIIEQMSLVKMNTLHWHLTDDQGWRIEIKRYPRLTYGNDYFTQDEIRDLVVYAATRGIEVIPEIEMPGHITGLLAAYPEYSCSGKERQLAKSGGIYPVILCGGSEKTYDLLVDLFDEICPLFPGSRFHIGGDEAPKKEWQKCPCCQQRIKENGLTNETELQGYLSNRVVEILAKHGKTAICWNDSLEAANLNQNVSIQFWSIQYAESFAPFVKNGGKFIYSDMFTYYLDYPHAMSSLRRIYCEPQIIVETDYSDHPAMLGIEACLWSEHIKDERGLEEHLFPRLYAVAEIAWSKNRDYDDFKMRLQKFLDKYHPGDMGYVPVEGWEPQGQIRQQEAIAYWGMLMSSMPEEVRKETMEAAAPSKLFQQRFAQSFFQPEDLPLFMKMSGF